MTKMQNLFLFVLSAVPGLFFVALGISCLTYSTPMAIIEGIMALITGAGFLFVAGTEFLFVLDDEEILSKGT